MPSVKSIVVTAAIAVGAIVVAEYFGIMDSIRGALPKKS